MSKSVTKWFSGGRGESFTSARLDAELHEVLHALLPRVQQGQLESLAVTSAETGEGRTTTALHLAEALADHLSERILLVDADCQRPALHREQKLDCDQGLGEVLRGQRPLAELVQPSLHDGLDLLCMGRAEPATSEDWTPESMARLMDQARGVYRVTVFDTPALLSSQEGSLISHLVMGVVLVVLAGITQGEFVARAHRVLLRAQAPLVGVIVNDPRDEFKRDET